MRPSILFFCGLVSAAGSSLRSQTPADSTAEIPEQRVVEDGEGEFDTPTVRSGFRSRYQWRLQEARGYADGTYAGSRLKSYQRLVLVPAPYIRGALLATKDPGEPRLAEFVSANIIVSAGSASLLVGDYRLELGQGLLFWRGYGLAKGANVIAPAYRSPSVLVTSLSADENRLFRGAAARWRSRRLDVLLFVSRRHRAATDESGNAHLVASSVFRTESERAKRDRLLERIVGGAAEMTFGASRLGVLAARAGFDPPVAGVGTGQSMLSLYADAGSAQTRIFGEAAWTGAAGGATAGVMMAASAATRLIACARLFPRNFTALSGLGFGERLGGANERGIYVGIDHAPAPRWRCSAYVDRFWFPEPSPQAPYGAGGYDALVEVRREPLLVRCQVKSQLSSSGDVAPPGGVTRVTERETVWRFRLEAQYAVARDVLMRSRLEKLFLALSPAGRREQGVLFYHDIAASPFRRLSVNLRLTFFATGSFASRLFAYERDLDGVLSLPAFSGSGSRWYLLVRWRAGDHVTASLKFSETVRDDVRFIGSGSDRLPSNRESQLGFQLDCTL